MRKRILVIAGGNYISGAEKIALDVIQGFKEHGHEVHCLVSGWNDGNFINKLNQLSISYSVTKLGWYYISKIMWSLDSFVHYPKATLDFLRIERKFQPDIVYAISYKQIVLLYPFLKSNIVYHVHDPNSHSKLSQFFLRLIDKKVLKYIAVSQFIKNDLEMIGIEAKKIEVIYNGIDLPKEAKKTPFDRPRIGIIGQLIPRKGHLVLLQAARLLVEKYNQKFIILIIGSGDEKYRQQLLKYVHQNSLDGYVQFKGHIKSTSEIYDNIDLTVIPSFSEAFGLIAVESFFYKTPVIASRVGGLAEIVLNGETGYLFTSGDAIELADKINLLLNDPSLVKKMADEGFEYCRSKFLKSAMLSRFENLVENL